MGCVIKEDQIEDDPENDPDVPGKRIAVNNNNDDGDKGDDVTDFADGFDGRKAPSDERFVPLVIEVPEAIDLEKARLKIEYSDSNPDDVDDKDGDGKFELPAPNNDDDGGNLRLWTKDGNKNRDAASIEDDGDFVPAKTYTDLTKLFEDGKRKTTLYVEGIRGTKKEDIDNRRITVEIDPNGEDKDPGFVCMDKVFVRVFGCPIVNVKFEATKKSKIEDMDNVQIGGNVIVPGNLGKRIFPGKRRPNDSGKRDVVKVIVEFEENATPPEKIFLKSFDVDDPSASNSPIDDEGHGDNRGRETKQIIGHENPTSKVPISKTKVITTLPDSGLLKPEENKSMKEIVMKETKGRKEVSVKFKVTMSPGDNLRVCAACKKKELNKIEAHHPDGNQEARVFNQDNQPIPDNDDGIAKVKSTDVLTSWRKLHVEVNSMRSRPIVRGRRDSVGLDTEQISIANLRGYRAGSFLRVDLEVFVRNPGNPSIKDDLYEGEGLMYFLVKDKIEQRL